MKYVFFIVVAAFLMLVNPAVATHMRAGEITLERIDLNSLSYEITITAYTNTSTPVKFGYGWLDVGDGRDVIALEDLPNQVQTIDLGNEVAINIYKYEVLYASPGTYTISYQEFYRNGSVVNMGQPLQTPFYIQTQIVIDPFFGVNNTPQLLVPPVDRAATGVRFIHNPGAYDPDGDSLSYKLVVCMQNRGPILVHDYKWPHDEAFYPAPLDYYLSNQDRDGIPTLSLDSLYGDLIWDAPGVTGDYNIAFLVEEWRKIEGEWYKLGYVERDMQIKVEDSNNNPPLLEVPPDLCVIAGEQVQETITATDADGHRIRIASYGGVYEVPVSPAWYTPSSSLYQNSPATLNFNWQTSCEHVMNKPYQVHVKATDTMTVLDQYPPLADIRTFQITVVGPPPEGLNVEAIEGRHMQLTWDNYKCQNAETMQVWRRSGTYDFIPSNCETGIPASGGYKLISELPLSNTSYVDDNNGLGLSVGLDYCYRLLAIFPQPGGGESLVSMEVCEVIVSDVPMITRVSVEETSETGGVIEINWIPPQVVDSSLLPLKYKMVRAEGLIGDAGKVIISEGYLDESDMLQYDSGLNTLEKGYNYRVYVYADGEDVVFDSSSIASSPRVNTNAAVGAIALNWNAEVPWNNNTQDYPYHYIYRNQMDDNLADFVLVDSVNVLSQGFTYTDDGAATGGVLSDSITYCYYIVMYGSYGNDSIPDPLINKSQIICDVPRDTIAPCNPIAIAVGNVGLMECEVYMAGRSCGDLDFGNYISWTSNDDFLCDNDIESYNVYFSETGDNDSYDLIANVVDMEFMHEGMNSFKGCYRIAAVDSSQNESDWTQAVCNDNCPQYDLPNVFTPNGDSFNETFRAIGCPWFAQEAQFNVYNRWGKEVFHYHADTYRECFINWDGKDSHGKELSSGIYYYTLIVKFDVLDESQQKKEFKGWLHLFRTAADQ